MFRARVMPCLLLMDEALVKTIKFKNPTYVGDPVNAVRIYNELEVDELIFLDITATIHNRKPPFRILEEIASECFMPVAYGGGIKTLDDVQTIFKVGVEKIVVNSIAFESPSLVRTIAERYGTQSVVVSIDTRKNGLGRYEVFTRSGSLCTSKDPISYAKEMESLGAGEILLYAIDRDGTHEGYDLELVRQVADAVTIPVVACGGAGKVSDFTQAVKVGGASACAAGSMVVHYGPHRAVLINFPEIAEIDRALAP